MKTCTKCLEVKPVDAFSFRNKAKGIKLSQCKSCMKENNKKHYNDNKEVYIDRAKQRRQDNWKWFKEFKSTLVCERCGFDHPAALQFHHIDGDEKESEVGKLVHAGCTIDKIMSEINKCEILCANCHMIHHFG